MKYVIRWENDKVKYVYYQCVVYNNDKHYAYADDKETKTIIRSARLIDAVLFDTYKDASVEYDRIIKPDTTAEIVEVTDKELFKARLSEE